MFAGGRRRSSKNVRAMQLFHELKQQFPTIPDHVVSACIASNGDKSDSEELKEILNAAANLQNELMGRHPCDDTIPAPFPTTPKTISDYDEVDVTLNSPINQHFNLKPNTTMDGEIPSKPKKPSRPDSLDLKKTFPDVPNTAILRTSEKCKDVHKLLNAEKPPISPNTQRRLNPKNPQGQKVTEISDLSENISDNNVVSKTDCSEFLNKRSSSSSPNSGVNLSLNVNCSVDVVRPKHTTSLHIVPHHPWCQDTTSPRSYTSVNLTLRSPSSEPQAPIDITSHNSSLTYSTSSFDSQKGLQSKLQITVSPTGGSVSSIRTRPRSFYLEDDGSERMQPAKIGSLQELSTSPVIVKQQARLERLKKELNSEKQRLLAIQTEVTRLENSINDVNSDRTDAELEKQLQKDIQHLRGQCEKLTIEVDRQTETGAPLGETNQEFYRNIYMGQRGPPNFGRPILSPTPRLQEHHEPSNCSQNENFGPKWSCPLCTFQNHPLLDKCEQCEMARILHGIDERPNNATNDSFSGMLNLPKPLGPGKIANAANSLLQFVTKSTVKPHRASDGIYFVKDTLQSIKTETNNIA